MATKWSQVLQWGSRKEAECYRDVHCPQGQVRKRRNVNDYYIVANPKPRGVVKNGKDKALS